MMLSMSLNACANTPTTNNVLDDKCHNCYIINKIKRDFMLSIMNTIERTLNQ